MAIIEKKVRLNDFIDLNESEYDYLKDSLNKVPTAKELGSQWEIDSDGYDYHLSSMLNYQVELEYEEQFDETLEALKEVLNKPSQVEVFESLEAINGTESPEARYISNLLEIPEKCRFIRLIDIHTAAKGRTYIFEVDKGFDGAWERLEYKAQKEAYSYV